MKKRLVDDEDLAKLRMKVGTNVSMTIMRILILEKTQLKSVIKHDKEIERS